MQEEHVQTCVGAVPDAVVEAFHESSGRFSALGAQPGGRAQVCQDGDGREPPPSPLHLPETRRKGDAWSTVCISCLPRHRAARLELQRDVRSWRGVRDAVMASYVAAPWGSQGPTAGMEEAVARPVGADELTAGTAGMPSLDPAAGGGTGVPRSGRPPSRAGSRPAANAISSFEIPAQK